MAETFFGQTFDWEKYNPQASAKVKQNEEKIRQLQGFIAEGREGNWEEQLGRAIADTNYYTKGKGYQSDLQDWQLKTAEPYASKLGVTTAQLITNPQLSTDAQALAKYKGISLAEAQQRIATLGGLNAPAGGAGSFTDLETQATAREQASGLNVAPGGVGTTPQAPGGAVNTTQPQNPTPTTPPPGQTAQPTAYTIQPGDTLSALALKNNTTVQALMAANPQITNPNLIIAGQNLNIPGQQTTTTPPAGQTPATGQPGASGGGSGGGSGDQQQQIQNELADKQAQADALKKYNLTDTSQLTKDASGNYVPDV